MVCDTPAHRATHRELEREQGGDGCQGAYQNTYPGERDVYKPALILPHGLNLILAQLIQDKGLYHVLTAGAMRRYLSRSRSATELDNSQRTTRRKEAV